MKVFNFLLVMLLLFCASMACSQALEALLFYLRPQRVMHSSLRSVTNRPGFALCTGLSVSSLVSFVPRENFGGLVGGSLDTYFQLYFLRSLSGFEVFIKKHRRKADTRMFVFRL